jgi:hypothetical protein
MFLGSEMPRFENVNTKNVDNHLDMLSRGGSVSCVLSGKS